MDLNSSAGVSAYDDLPLWSAAFGLLLLEHLPYGRDCQDVLDVGCGTGFPAIELAERYGADCRVDAVDRWSAALERARAKAATRGVNNVYFHEADAAALPFGNAAFDLIVSNLGINNFERPAVALAECARVLRPGGRIALTTNLAGHMSEFYALFRETLEERGDTDGLEALERQESSRNTELGVCALLSDAGFATTELESRKLVMSFRDGGALLNHSFVKLAFLEGWAAVVSDAGRERTFEDLRKRLDIVADHRGGLHLSIPMLFVLAQR